MEDVISFLYHQPADETVGKRKSGNIQRYYLSLAGNWLEEKETGSTADEREHDAQNQITDNSGVTPLYDESGNTTKIGADNNSLYFTIVYDPWNRPVQIKDNVNTVRGEFTYDGLGRVVERDLSGSGGDERHLYCSTAWQVLAERINTDPESPGDFKMEYVWGAQYIDEIVCRIDHSGEDPVRKKFVQDANWNVITLLDTKYRNTL